MRLRPALVLVICCCLLGCANHYNRDFTAALEAQLEAPPPLGLGLSSHEYLTITSVYFVPNLFTPLLAGVASQVFGAAACLLVAAAVATLGNLVFIVGVVGAQPLAVLVAGRLCIGLSYEALDAVWMPLL